MSNEELTILLLDKIGWDYDKVLNPNHFKSSKDLYAGDLILGIFNTRNIKETCALIGFSYKVVCTAIERFFNPQFGTLSGGGETWRFRFLLELQFKYCSDCKKLLSFTEFDIDNYSNSTGRHGYCKQCRKEFNAKEYQKDSTKESHKRSYNKNYAKILERNQHYKGERSLRIPKWSETEQIVEFYSKCPENHHVDHEIPLKGELVSGLHVIKNLQYLSSKENMKKGNRYAPVC